MDCFKSLAATKAALADKAPAMRITKTQFGEYRITFTIEAIRAAYGMSQTEAVAEAESIASYQTDLESAYGTALAMARVGLAPQSDLSLAKHEGVELSAPETPAETPAPEAARFIDITPTWESLIPAFVALIENGDSTGRATAIHELKRLAAMGDSVIAESKAGIIAEYKMRRHGANSPGAIVLHKTTDGGAPFVCHFRNDDDSERVGRPCYYFGDYCNSLADGFAAFADKIRRYDPTGELLADGAESVA